MSGVFLQRLGLLGQVSGAPETFNIALAGDEQGGSDALALLGDEQSGGDAEAYIVDIEREVLLQTIDLTDVTEIDIDLPAGYFQHIIEGLLEVGTTGVSIRCRFTNDGFTSVREGATDYSYADQRFAAGNSTEGETFDATADHIQLAVGMRNNATDGFFGAITVFNALDAALQTGFDNDSIRTNASGNGSSAYGFGKYNGTAEAHNGIRFYVSAGDFDIAKLRVWGVPNV